MNKNNRLRTLLIGLCLSSIFFFSCVDQDYDLEGKLDKTFALGGANLTFPLGSIDSIKLNKIIRRNEQTSIYLKNGEYSIARKSQIESFNIMVPTAPPINIAEVTLPDIPLCPKGVYPSGDVAATSVTSPLNFIYKTLPQEVRSVKSFIFPTNSPVKMTVKLTVNGLAASASLKLKSINIAFPKYIISKNLNAKNEFVISNERLSGTLTKEILISAFDFSKETEGVIPIVYQTINVKKNITVSGTLNCTNFMPSNVSSSAKIGVSVSLAPIKISTLEGNINPSIKMYIQPLPFDIPDFLNDDDIIMDAQDPLIRLKVRNELELPIEIKGILQGYRAGRVLNQVMVKAPTPILVDANGQTIICLSRSGLAGEDGTKKYRISDLNNLIVRIPDQIRFSVDANALPQAVYKVELGKKYKIGVDSEIEVPLKFGPGLSVVYNDTIDHFNKQMKGITATEMNFSVGVENNIPLVLKLEAFPIGVDKTLGILQGVKIRVNGEIKSCSQSGSAQRTNINANLIETIPGALKQLDGLIFKVTAISTETINGMPLRESQYLRIKDIKAQIVGGISVDLNK